MENQNVSRIKITAVLLGVLVSSFGVLAFELSLTRIFSIMLDYHYSFLVISVAIFGLGLGGIIAHYYSSKTFLKDNFNGLAILAVIFSFSMIFFTLIAVSFPNLNMILQAFIMFLPFLIAGTLLAMAYKIFVRSSSMLHFADLIGAALGSLAVVFLLNWVGAIVAVLLISLVTLISSLLFSFVSKKKLTIAITLLAIIGVSLFAQYSSTSNLWNIQPASDQGKELSSFLSTPSIDAKIVDSRWSSFGRIDLVASQALPHEKVIFVDGGAGTTLYHFNGDFNSNDSLVPALRNSTMYFPYYFADKGSSLVIGPGGGVDVLTPLMAGVNQIYAVEVNPGIVGIVRDYSAYNGGIYTNYSNVHVTIDDGRSYVKRSNQKYDTIMLDIPLTKTAQGTLGYSLAENYLFTTDSFTDYLNHLNNDGFLTIVAHDQEEIYKLVSLAFQVLGAQGLSPQQIMARIAVVGSEDMMDHSALPVFMLKKTPIKEAQAVAISSKASEEGFGNLYSPLTSYNRYDNTSTDDRLNHLAIGQMSINDLVSTAPFNMKAATDDNPFFYNFDLGIPSALVPLIVGAIILSIAVSIIYAATRRREEVSFKNGIRIKLKTKFSSFKWYCFASLGLGFMLIEIALIQKFILFLGEPTLAIAISLFSLLLAGGLGSFFSRKWSDGKQYNAFKVSLIIATIAIVYIFTLPTIFNATLGYTATFRFLISFILIFPLGFMMGIPFPTILGYIKQEFENDAAWMWCINGAFSVLGGVLALVIAMLSGFNAVLLLGAITYLGIFLVGRIHERKKLLEKVKVKWINPRISPRKVQSKKFKRI